MNLRPTPTPLPALADDIARWQQTSYGRGLSVLAQREVAQRVPELFGRHFLQIGEWDHEHDWLASAVTLNRAVLAVERHHEAACRVDPAALPFTARSIDAVLLPHTIERVPSAHGLLREVSRVLSDRGHLMMIGFNPWGALAWRRRMGLAPKQMPAQRQWYSAGRVIDWLKLLGFEVLMVRRFGYGFPWMAPREDRGRLEIATLAARLSDAYVIHARKRVAPLNRIGQTRIAKVRTLVPVPVAGRISQTRQPADRDS